MCKLQCISNANFYALREPGKYADGTRCWHDETGEQALTKACVDGLCKVGQFAIHNLLNISKAFKE